MDNALSMSADALSLCAYAKINIHLKVLAKRNDGFHNLESIFQRISIADYLSIARSDNHRDCIIDSPLMQLPYDNTLTKAWDIFRSVAKINGGIQVRILKNIPAGSGLGAGSSDAASLLMAVNELFHVHYTTAELKKLAEQVGSDVPFFLTDPASVVVGRGERCIPIQARTDCFGILIWPEVHSSTKEAYRLLDSTKQTDGIETVPWGAEKMIAHYRLPIEEWRFVNDFQPVMETCYPVVEEVCRDLYNNGAAFARMSGSGSAVFGLFLTAAAVQRAADNISKKWKWCKPFVLLVS